MTIFHTNGHLNKHGYFSVGNQNLYSKLDAIQMSMRTGESVQWHFNDDVFKKQDWTAEPETDIKTMYRERAQAIRDQFDYVVVMFSGGADSTTILDSFIDNNIPIDEVFMHQWIKYQPEGADSYMNTEITYSALPYLKRKLPTAWNTTVRLHDPSDYALAQLNNADFRQRSNREVNNIHNLQMISLHHNLHRRFPEYVKLIEQGKRIVFVWGEAKPHVTYDLEKNKHFFYFEDHYAHAPQPRDQEQNDPACQHEQFYDDPQYPQIKIKQAHLLLNVLKQIKHRTDIFFAGDNLGKDSTHPDNYRAISAVTYYNDQRYVLDRNAFNCAIYPDWNFLTYHQDKQPGRVIHPAHAWIERVDPVASKKWMSEYINTYSQLPEEWTKYFGGLKNGIKRLKIPYYLE
jgi:hypothetical protein